MTTPVAGVYRAILSVQVAIGHAGIGKDRKNLQQGFMFRGIDDIYNAVSPLLSEAGLLILPRMVEREHEERITKSGAPIHYVTVAAEFDFVCVEDGSTHVVRTYGEAMDTADKATNKAMSAAYKYACMQAFAIPTEGTPDADEVTPEASAAVQRNIGNPVLLPEQFDAMDSICKEVVQFVNDGAHDAALEYVQEVQDTEEKRYLWWRLGQFAGVQDALRKAAEQQQPSRGTT